MGWRIKQLLRTKGFWVIACAVASAPASAPAAGAQRLAMRSGLPDVRPAYATVGADTNSPIGWTEFCIEHRSECDNRRTALRDVVLSPKAWTDMVKVNAWVNNSIKPITDQEHWGVVENWSYPDDGYGDCEDYVLLKRRMLMQAGWPREALLITVVRDKKGDGHAVLTVKTNRGEFILDNQESEVLPWNRTGYRFVKRQSQTNPNVWVSLDEPRAEPATVSAR
jgi:predicted transglutaminase-like cysteine proteinase